MMQVSVSRRAPASVGAALLLTSGIASAAGARPDASAADASPRELRSFGEPGDVVLGDVIGARTARAPTTGLVAVGVGAGGAIGGVGALGAVVMPEAAPSVSAAWFGLTSASAGVDGAPRAKWSTARFEPSVDVFVARGLSLGGAIGFEMSRVRFGELPAAFDATALSFDPRAGYAVPLGSTIALWPRIRAGITVQQSNLARASRGYRLGADLPVVIRLARHVLVDFGPEIAYSAVDMPGGVASRSAHVAGRAGLSLIF